MGDRGEVQPAAAQSDGDHLLENRLQPFEPEKNPHVPVSSLLDKVPKVQAGNKYGRDVLLLLSSDHLLLSPLGLNHPPPQHFYPFFKIAYPVVDVVLAFRRRAGRPPRLAHDERHADKKQEAFCERCRSVCNGCRKGMKKSQKEVRSILSKLTLLGWETDLWRRSEVGWASFRP